MQGRFSEEVAGKFQHFPIDNWEKEFSLARKLKFDCVEWIVSDYSNPIFSNIFRKLIKNTLKKNKLKISSISLDMIMDNPLHKLSINEVSWIVSKLKIIVKELGIKRISVPIEERARYNNKYEKMLALNNLKAMYVSLNKYCNICIETDISPIALIDILKMKKFRKLGILLDLGNTRAHGFKIEEYFNPRILKIMNKNNIMIYCKKYLIFFIKLCLYKIQ